MHTFLDIPARQLIWERVTEQLTTIHARAGYTFWKTLRVCWGCVKARRPPAPVFTIIQVAQTLASECHRHPLCGAPFCYLLIERGCGHGLE